MLGEYEDQFDSLYLGGQKSKQSKHQEKEAAMLYALQSNYQLAQQNYRKALLHPENYTGAKVPTEIPQETATAQLKWNFNLTPNASGKFLIVIDPSVQGAFQYNDALVDGVGGGTLTNLTFAQDANIIDMWRLVSASVIVQYVGRMDATAGFLVGAVTSNLSNATQTTFLTFNNIEDLQNRRVVAAIEGMKLIYSPYDTSQLDYYTQTVYSGNSTPTRWKQLFVIYGDGLPNTSCIRIDYVRNIEYVAKTSFREYIPHQLALPCKLDYGIISEVKKKEIQTLDV